MSKNRRHEIAPSDVEKIEGADYVMLPGMKQRMEVPRVPLIGQTIVLPARFGSLITASSGTSIHSLSTRTRFWPLLDSQSGSERAKPSASEQHGPLPDLRPSNHGLSGDSE